MKNPFPKRAFAVLLAAATCALGGARAQQVGWEADFNTRFDNREYAGCAINPSQTIFLADLATSVTYGWSERNLLRFGVEMQKDFGARDGFFSEVRPLVGYQYRGQRLGADVGIFARDRLAGDYSPAFFNDSLRVYDPTLQGMAVRYDGAERSFRAELALNWEGMYSEASREKFRVFGSVVKGWPQARAKRWYVGGAFSVFHFANNAHTSGNVVDNLLVSPYAGFASHSETEARTFWYDLRAGFLWAPQRDRIGGGPWRAPRGGEVRIRLGWHGISFENNLYFGDDLMPLFDRYGSELYAGERWYSTREGLYNRTRIGYDRSFFDGTVDVSAGMVFHCEGKGFYSQQVVRIGVHLGKSLYDARNHKRK